MNNRMYNVNIVINQAIDDVLQNVGEGNRSKGVRLLAKQYSKDVRNEMDVHSDILPVPGSD